MYGGKLPEKTKEIVTPKEYQAPKVEFKHTAKFIFNKTTYLVRSKESIPKGTSFAEILKPENVNEYKIYPLDAKGKELHELNVFVRGNMSTGKGIKKAKRVKEPKKEKTKPKKEEKKQIILKGYEGEEIKIKPPKKPEIKGIEEYEKEAKEKEKTKPKEKLPSLKDFEGRPIKIKKKKKPKIKEKYE